jgi:branched-chain amino acid transport system permease protein
MPDEAGREMVDVIISQVVNGLVLGFIYVLIAIGMSVILGLMGVANFAHGALFALGAYFALGFRETLGWPGVVLAPLAVGLVGMVLEVTLFRHLYRFDHLATLIMTFALALFIESVIRAIWGPAGQPFQPPAFLTGFYEYGPILVTKYRATVLLITALALLLLAYCLEFTSLGRILRAGSRDAEMVSMLGINMPRVFTVVFGVGAMLAGLAGLLAAPLWSITPSMSEQAIMPAIVTVAIGGLGSYAGAIVAGLLIGVTTALTIQFWPEASSASMYMLMVLVLMIRPRGLLGEKWERFE